MKSPISQSKIVHIMKSLLAYPLLILSVFQFAACNAQEPDPVKNPVYESCCGADPIEYNVGKDYVYLPNVFTPNGDGINDVFQPVFDLSRIAKVTQYTMYYDTILEPGPILYSRGSFFPGVNPQWWDGKDQDGKPWVGSFEYDIEFRTVDGDLITFSGRACAIECGTDAAEFKDRKGCFFPSQVNADGKHDPTLPNKDDGCFK